MNELSKSVRDYYFSNFDKLPEDKQFHLASRLYLWNQDPEAQQRLALLKSYFTANGSPESALNDVIERSLSSPVHGSKNAAELRRPYFEKYPKLKVYVSALFRITFLKSIYGIDVRQEFYNHFPKEEIESFMRGLLNDRAAISILSTHAINFLYLYSRVITEDKSAFDTADFIEIGNKFYNESDKLHLQLLIYLYTHCIIGETEFYHRSLPADNTHTRMVKQLDQIIESNFENINLDNKFEFLVCLGITGQDSRLRQRIYDEALNSVSDKGTYLVDKHNNNPQSLNVSLGGSEHRNVLFMMATSEFSPLG